MMEDEPKPNDRSAGVVTGYAAGMGIVGIALVGVPLQFAYPDVSALLTYGGSFVFAGIIGAAVAGVRGTRSS